MAKRSYEHHGHTKYIMRYHIIFSTKFRKKMLSPIKDDILSSFKRAQDMQDDWSIEIVDIDKIKDDHIHILLRGTPNTCISEVVHKLKQVSTYDMYQQNYDYMTKFYWKQHLLWTRGYFCSTIGEISEETLRKYIESQG